MKTNAEFKLINESCKIYEHKSGIKIYVIEKPQFNTTFAAYGTRYGSIDTMFRKEDEENYTIVPEGIAHFLEHKNSANSALPTTHLHLLTVLVTIFPVQIILTDVLKFYLILCKILISPLKPSKKNREL